MTWQEGEASKSKGRSTHPYLAGNFYPVKKETDLVACTVASGAIPQDLAGGQYLRNGGNAFHPPEEGQAYHFFDADGMIHGVFFRKEQDGRIVPCYVNKYVQTDVLLATKKRGSTLIPSIASLIAPISKYPVQLLITMLRTVFICYLSSLSRLSVANTLVTFHNRKLLATCESGPMIRLTAPELETKGWEVFLDEETGEGLGKGKQVVGRKLGKKGQMLEEWTTGHPKVCPVTGDLIFYGYNIFAAPFVTHSVVKADGSHSPSFKTPIPGIARPKMMHDFACSLHHSIILDLPLTMDPMNIVLAQPMLTFNRTLKSRFAVFPRYYDGKDTSQVKWFESPEPSLIFHTADAWDEGLSGEQYDDSPSANDELVAVNMFGCRFRTSKLVYSVGGMVAPAHEEKLCRESEDNVLLTYFRFSMRPSLDPLYTEDEITHAFALSAIPLDFPVTSQKHAMRQHRFLYGCTAREGRFDSELEGAKVDCIVKLDAESLRQQGIALTAQDALPRFEPVDKRGVLDVLEEQEAGHVENTNIRIFSLPRGIHGQEPALVPKKNAQSEDDAYLVFYAYDESQLLPNGEAPDDSHSQLWVIDASLMGVVSTEEATVARIDLPSRVPYGLHAAWITADQIDSQIKDRKNANAAIIQDMAISTPLFSEETEEKVIKPRLRGKTITAAERNDELEKQILEVGNMQDKDRAGFLIWFVGVFWMLMGHLHLANPRIPAPRQAKRPNISRKCSTPAVANRPSVQRAVSFQRS